MVVCVCVCVCVCVEGRRRGRKSLSGVQLTYVYKAKSRPGQQLCTPLSCCIAFYKLSYSTGLFCIAASMTYTVHIAQLP